MANAGDPCVRCGKGTYEAFRGIEVGQVFKLGTKYSEAMRCVFLDEAGAERPMVMGCYGIGITRTIAAVIEQNFDGDGVIWPWPVAPYHVHLVTLDANKPEIAEVANELERQLEAAGLEVLHDDRDGLSPGVKFKDADLLGMPLRLVVGAKGLKEGIVELRNRRTKEVQKVKPGEVLAAVLVARTQNLEPRT
jgi:prolyl-tRNA synthetase